MKAPLGSITPERFAYLTYPLLASPKLDGIRATVQGGKLLSSSLKLIANDYCQQLYGQERFEGLDGELVVGNPTAANVFNVTSSGVRRKQGKPNVAFYVFDTLSFLNRFSCFNERQHYLEAAFRDFPGMLAEANVIWHQSIWIHNAEDLASYVSLCLEEGYEGVMVRPLPTRGYYHEGRCTPKDNLIHRIKPLESMEGTICGYEEQLTNTNPAFIAEIGYQKRSKEQAGLIPAGTMGKLLVTTAEFGTVRIGTGFSDAEALEFWNNKEKYLGTLVRFDFQRTGTIDAPRSARYKGIRPAEDISLD
jgi:DNA ligase-1